MNEPNGYLRLYSRGITFWSITAFLALGSPIAYMAVVPHPQNASPAPSVVSPIYKIQKIEIQGNHVFTADQIKGEMKLIKEGDRLTAPIGKDFTDLKLQDALTRIRILYGERGYVRVNVLDPIVEVKKAEVGGTLENQYFITFKIEENNQYRINDVQVKGNKQFTSDEIRRAVGLVSGQVYNETMLREGFEKLKKMYASRGFSNFVPDPTFNFDETKSVVSLTINIQEN